MMVGAILTQNTAWTQVEQAIRRLRAARALDPARMHAAPIADLADWIRPAGTPRVKVLRLRALTALIVERFGGRLDRLFALDTDALRRTLLGVHGIGPETADCILLYAAKRPVFVVDAYTRRVLERHRWIRPGADYAAVAELFTASLPRDAALFNEYHALLVAVGKRHCRAKPDCAKCPLRRWLPRN